MPKGDKYLPLMHYLQNSGKDQIVLTFDELEKITGGLPASAYKYSACWNDSSGHSLSYGWLNAGYSVKGNLVTRTAVFTKIGFKPLNHVVLHEVKEKKIKSPLYRLSADEAVAKAKKYDSAIKEGAYTRYRSWEHCHKAFKENLFKKDSADYLALHLAWYLASWGMLRNSFLQNFDYTIHKDLIERLSDCRFELLFSLKPAYEKIFHLIDEAREIIIDVYSKYSHTFPTDTFITKILLGIFGCVPAYDRFFKNGVVDGNICRQKFDLISLRQLWNYYNENYEVFEKARKELSKNASVEITPMKLMDMCFWQLGFDKQ